jgi:hypothetical protein
LVEVVVVVVVVEVVKNYMRAPCSVSATMGR